MSDHSNTIHTRIWEEIPEPDNPFAAAVCRCAGYDVYSDLLGHASWIEYLYLLFKQERPTAGQARILEGLAVALANPGPRDPSIHAAMSGGVGNSTHASCLMAALAVGAGQMGGAHEVALAMEYWRECGTDLTAWRQRLTHPSSAERSDIWSTPEHPPGFDPHGSRCTLPVRQTLAFLAQYDDATSLAWLNQERSTLENFANHPLSMQGVAAAALTDLGFDSDQGEMLCLLLRLPGAAAHALEQRQHGWRNFPFFADGLVLSNDPNALEE